MVCGILEFISLSSTTQAKASRLLGRVFLTRGAQEMQTLPSQFLQNLQSLWATPVTDKYKHRVVSYCNDETVNDAINSKRFTQLNVLSKDLYEVKSFKETVRLDLPLQIGFFVYGYAKLRMMQFYYDFLDYYLDRKSFALMEMDTDSCYFACACVVLILLLQLETRRQLTLATKRQI